LINQDRGKKTTVVSHAPRKDVDIPVAVRSDRSPAAKSDAGRRLPLVGIAIGAILAIGGVAGYNFLVPGKSAPIAAAPVGTTNDPKLVNNANPQPPAVETVLNHFAYTEAPASELVSIDGGFRLRAAAAKKYRAMITAARSAGVNITTISAFRSISEQERLFFEVGAQRGQKPTKRAEVSAPPKHSEHHTGYAVDLGDSGVPSVNLNTTFDTTPAYKWLAANAARYGFELSFPKDNPQGVSYEPWHWRYVGNTDSLETFYKARQLNQNKS
jgi:zinc D-Ala-D-Ala carboxypeptidase